MDGRKRADVEMKIRDRTKSSLSVSLITCSAEDLVAIHGSRSSKQRSERFIYNDFARFPGIL